MFIIKYKHEQWHMAFVAVVILKCHLPEMVSSVGDPKGHSINQQAEELPQTLVLRRHPGHCWLFPG